MRLIMLSQHRPDPFFFVALTQIISPQFLDIFKWKPLNNLSNLFPGRAFISDWPWHSPRTASLLLLRMSLSISLCYFLFFIFSTSATLKIQEGPVGWLHTVHDCQVMEILTWDLSRLYRNGNWSSFNFQTRWQNQPSKKTAEKRQEETCKWSYG